MEKEEWIKVWFNCITISTGSLDLISGFHVIPTWLRSSLRYHGHILISNFQSSTVQSAEHDFFHCMNSTLQCIRRIWAPQEEDCEMEINMQEIDEKKPLGSTPEEGHKDVQGKEASGNAASTEWSFISSHGGIPEPCKAAQRVLKLEWGVPAFISMHWPNI